MNLAKKHRGVIGVLLISLVENLLILAQYVKYIQAVSNSVNLWMLACFAVPSI